MQRLADVVAGRFCYGVMAASAATFGFWSLAGADWFPEALGERAGEGCLVVLCWRLIMLLVGRWLGAWSQPALLVLLASAQPPLSPPHFAQPPLRACPTHSISPQPLAHTARARSARLHGSCALLNQLESRVPPPRCPRCPHPCVHTHPAPQMPSRRWGQRRRCC